jgi:hypothetical protein
MASTFNGFRNTVGSRFISDANAGPAELRSINSAAAQGAMPTFRPVGSVMTTAADELSAPTATQVVAPVDRHPRADARAFAVCDQSATTVASNGGSGPRRGFEATRASKPTRDKTNQR